VWFRDLGGRTFDVFGVAQRDAQIRAAVDWRLEDGGSL
jgi:hypothetical protein